MTLPANIRINMGAPFPSTVKGSGPIVVSKQNGIWTVALNFAVFGTAQSVPDPNNTYTLVWNKLTGVFTLVPIGNLATIGESTKILTGIGATASPYAALPTDDVLIVKQGAANPFIVTVDWAARLKPLTIVAGDTPANFAAISITPKAGQTQLGQANFVYRIATPGGNVTLTPLPDGSGAY